MAKSSTLVAGPTWNPLPYGLFSVVTFRESDTERWRMGVEYDADAEMPSYSYMGFDACDDAGPDLSGEGLSTGEGQAFRVNVAYECSPVGNTMEFAEKVARDRLAANEERWVEEAIWGNAPQQTWNFLNAETRNPQTLPLQQALCAAEMEFLRQGILWTSRGQALYGLKQGLLETKGNRLFTKLGTPVVAAYGAANEDVYLTGPLVAYRGQVDSIVSSPIGTFDRANNTLFVNAGRDYLITGDPYPIVRYLTETTH